MNNEDEKSALLEQIASLQRQVTSLTNQVQTLQEAQKRKQEPPQQHHHSLLQQSQKWKRNELSLHATILHDEDRSSTSSSTTKLQQRGGTTCQLKQRKKKLGLHSSINTQQVLFSKYMAKNDLDDDNEENQMLAEKIIKMFKDPVKHINYGTSKEYATDIFFLCNKIMKVFENEPRIVFIQSPAYVFGDIHGNLEDLHFFSDNIWRLGMTLTAGNFVFLGDYVDRGLSSVEVVTYLLAMKLLLPNKVFLLRGNHETRDVNGWEEYYGERSFRYQCTIRFGNDTGQLIWEKINQVFDRMPLAAVIDNDIFCVHGGIPRPIEEASSLQQILNVPTVAGINPPYGHETPSQQQVSSDCIWSDPASQEQEENGTINEKTGFGESLRGGGTVCFGDKAITNFLTQNNLSYIMRAHEAHAGGVAVSKRARVFTIFSTSKDHHQGSKAMAGCILIDYNKLHIINKSPAYKNQYVHHRNSIRNSSMVSLPEEEIQRRMRLGLVIDNNPNSLNDDDDEVWDDFDEDGDENQEDSDNEPMYFLDANRRSSVDKFAIARIKSYSGDLSKLV